MQTDWGNNPETSDFDPWRNILCTWVEKGEKKCNKMLLCPWGKDMNQVRLEAAAFPGNVLTPDGWLYVCTHCGSRRMDKYGLASYDDDADTGDPYVWDQECIAAAVLVSEKEYQEGRRIYDSNVSVRPRNQP